MNQIGNLCRGLLGLFAVLPLVSLPAVAQKKPNIIMLMSDDVGWEDYGVYGGGVALGQGTGQR